MKKTILTIILSVILAGAVGWAAVAPRMQALVPLFIAIVAGEAIVTIRSKKCKSL